MKGFNLHNLKPTLKMSEINNETNSATNYLNIISGMFLLFISINNQLRIMIMDNYANNMLQAIGLYLLLQEIFLTTKPIWLNKINNILSTTSLIISTYGISLITQIINKNLNIENVITMFYELTYKQKLKYAKFFIKENDLKKIKEKDLPEILNNCSTKDEIEDALLNIQQNNLSWGEWFSNYNMWTNYIWEHKIALGIGLLVIGIASYIVSTQDVLNAYQKTFEKMDLKNIKNDVVDNNVKDSLEVIKEQFNLNNSRFEQVNIWSKQITQKVNENTQKINLNLTEVVDKKMLEQTYTKIYETFDMLMDTLNPILYSFHNNDKEKAFDLDLLKEMSQIDLQDILNTAQETEVTVSPITSILFIISPSLITIIKRNMQRMAIQKYGSSTAQNQETLSEQPTPLILKLKKKTANEMMRERISKRKKEHVDICKPAESEPELIELPTFVEDTSVNTVEIQQAVEIPMNVSENLIQPLDLDLLNVTHMTTLENNIEELTENIKENETLTESFTESVLESQKALNVYNNNPITIMARQITNLWSEYPYMVLAGAAVLFFGTFYGGRKIYKKLLNKVIRNYNITNNFSLFNFTGVSVTPSITVPGFITDGVKAFGKGVKRTTGDVFKNIGTRKYSTLNNIKLQKTNIIFSDNNIYINNKNNSCVNVQVRSICNYKNTYFIIPNQYNNTIRKFGLRNNSTNLENQSLDTVNNLSNKYNKITIKIKSVYFLSLKDDTFEDPVIYFIRLINICISKRDLILLEIKLKNDTCIFIFACFTSLNESRILFLLNALASLEKVMKKTQKAFNLKNVFKEIKVYPKIYDVSLENVVSQLNTLNNKLNKQNRFLHYTKNISYICTHVNKNTFKGHESVIIFKFPDS